MQAMGLVNDHLDGCHAQAPAADVTELPAVALAATWDPSLAGQYGRVIGAEEYGKGASANLGPTVNIDRDPRGPVVRGAGARTRS